MVEEAKKKNSIKKILLKIFAICLLMFLMVLAIVAWVCSELFDHKPLEEVTRTPDYKHIENITKKFGIDLDKKKKNNIAQQFLTLLMTPSKTVELSKEEVNSLLDSVTIGARLYLSQKMPNLTLSDMRFENGVLCADISFDSGYSTPFGKFLNGKIKLIPTISEKHFYLTITNLSLGGISVSGDPLQPTIDRDLKEFEKTEDGKAILNIITDFSVEKEYIKITFKPQELTMFVYQKMGNSSNGDGGMELLQKFLQ